MYIQYIQGLLRSRLGTADYALVTSNLHYNDSLVTWTVMYMTAAKFKPLIFSCGIGEGHSISYLVEALCYKPESRGFDFWRGQWIFRLTKSFQPHYCFGGDSSDNRNEYRNIFLGSKARPACKSDNLTAICHCACSTDQLTNAQKHGLSKCLSVQTVHALFWIVVRRRKLGNVCQP
jgi:hypothetical protein